LATLNVGEQLNQSITPFQAKTTFTGVRINFDDFEGVRRRVELDCVELVFSRVLLMLCGHPDVGSCQIWVLASVF